MILNKSKILSVISYQNVCLDLAQCNTIKAPSSGTIELYTNGTTTVAVISCDNGYTLSGNRNKTCGEDGSWSGSEVLCC